MATPAEVDPDLRGGMNLFVGREKELDEAVRLLLASEMGSVLDIVGASGLGKTSFMRELARRVDVAGLQDIVVEDMSRFLREGPEFSGEPSTGVLWDTFLRTSELMLQLAERIARQKSDSFRLKCASERRKLGRPPTDGDDRLKMAIRRSQLAVDNVFLDNWAHWSDSRRVLLTVDFFDKIADEEMGLWLARVARRLKNTLVVVARESLPNQTSDFSRWHVRSLSPLSRDEVACYLDEFFHELLDPVLADEIYRSSWGYPGVLSLVVEKIRGVDPRTLTPAELRRILPERLQAPPGGSSDDLRFVDLIADLVDPSLLDAVYACAVVSTFDEPLLAELLGGAENESSEVEPASAIRTLESLGIIEQVATDQLSRRFRLHEFIRPALTRILQELRPETWRDLHRRAAQHYFRFLSDWDDDNSASPVTSLYKYEHPVWLAYKREWFMHTGRASGDRVIVRARFSLLFLEAHWWYGNYEPFYVNRQMLDEWERDWQWTGSEAGGVAASSDAVQDDPDNRLHAALEFILDHYPTGWVKASAPWDDIRDELLVVRDLSGLDQAARASATTEEEKELKKLDGLLNIFLAHSRRYLDPTDRSADTYYDQAIADFAELDDEWNLAWLYFETADLALERGSLAEARTRVRDSAEYLKSYVGDSEDWDEELISDLLRIRAEVRWEADDVNEALTDYCRAVGHAYRCFFSPDKTPDHYESLFYEEMTTRTANRLVEIVDLAGVTEARRWADRVRELMPGGGSVGDDEVRDMLRDADLVKLRAWLFPRGPAPDEEQVVESAFFDEWTALNENTPLSDTAVELLRRW